MKKNIVIIAGPTASGKTKIGIELAKKIDGEIVSADSMQIYKYMDIGSAKPTREEMQGVPHHMIDVVDPKEEFSVALYRQMAVDCIDNIIKRGKVPIIVGGTGLYINSLTYPLDFTETAKDEEYRFYLQNLAEEKGSHFIHEMLKEVDPESYNRLHPNDLKRIIRALEVYKNTGRPISEFQRESKKREIDFNLAYFGLTMDRTKLYERINQRVDEMFEKGLIDEVKKLKEMGYTKDMTSMQGIGYKEVFDYLDGYLTLEEVKDIIKQNTRRYAKRQLTWFRREDRIFWINLDEFSSIDEVLNVMINYIKEKFMII
ncbi:MULTISPECIES: tRNA (adenosine(37)-N6)-dimethylallyltransferase MiaA [Caloramator]|uniref:tRNA dimethylallyltransferase n=1 Tax=Caloramator australicus RC3 TaxID=857293 RepID=I7LFN2_9CLOT|nr:MULTISPECIES: tRNA (adenosine(37)-N6)-dimethylallyltransferase MiaA [Caloramator]MDO6355441.1 tRNA (adenosine(37)-N6)-dimethylallyltransferase MiaA [Caloramator sp. CAR-1]CCJ32635.1 tRNA delta(2)-isopentenylpyrophosphate transferase [Caloramator australicus RC3]